jgi:hypothetical protein
MSEEKPAAVPTLVSLLICDQVIDDKLTNKKSAIGIFNAVLVPQAPTTLGHVVVLASLTDIKNRVVLRLRLVRDIDNEVLFETQGPVESPDPLGIVDLIFNMHGLRISAAGPYAFEILCGQELLARRRFQVVVRPPRQSERGQPNPPMPS